MTPEQLAVTNFMTDPVQHIREVQGVDTMEPFQKRICEALVHHERVSVAACHDVGKTFTAAKIVLWFTSSYEGAKVITTAPTYNQVKRLLWSEINSGFQRSKMPLGGKMLGTEWTIGTDWFALGFTSQPGAAGTGETQGTASGFQGFHGKYVLVVFDEATGISPNIWTQLEGILTSGFVRFLAIGNPTSKGSKFFQTFQAPGVHKIYLSCFDSPNLKANGIVDMPSLMAEVNRIKSMEDMEAERALSSYKIVQPYLLSTRWVIERAIEWGLDHPLFVSKCLGQFPEEDDHALFSLGTVEQAMLYRDRSNTLGPIAIGVDVARFGSDKTVITRMDGCHVTNVKKLVKKSTTETTGEVVALINACPRAKAEGAVIVVDETGIGSGVVDSLKEYQLKNMDWRHIRVIGVNFGAGFNDEIDRIKEEKSKKYANKKAELFLMLAADMKTDITLINDAAYTKELPTIIYRFDAKGRYIIEGKEEYKKRTGMGSPDTSDSLALANYARKQNTFNAASPKMEASLSRPLVDSLNAKENW